MRLDDACDLASEVNKNASRVVTSLNSLMSEEDDEEFVPDDGFSRDEDEFDAEEGSTKRLSGVEKDVPELPFLFWDATNSI